MTSARVAIDYDCPNGCLHSDPHMDHVGPNNQPTHYGANIGPFWFQGTTPEGPAALRRPDRGLRAP
jgi:hypothetical protein